MGGTREGDVVVGPAGRTRRTVRRGTLVVSALAGCSDVNHAADLPIGPAIQPQLRSVSAMGSVLLIAALFASLVSLGQ